MIDYTIIIPHKNIPHLLQRCLDSIPRRDDVQIIVVDDNSDAGIVDFDNFPGLRDPYVEVIFGKNEDGRKGAGYARNLALERAQGKWLVFADADDFFNPCFEEALDKYKDDENEIVFFRSTSVFSDSNLPADRDEHANALLGKIELTGNWDYALQIFTTWGKFVKRKFIQDNDIVFQEVMHSNDVNFSVKSTMLSRKKTIDESLFIYCINYRENSLTQQMTVDAIKVRFDVVCQITRYLKKYKKRAWTRMRLWGRWLWLFREDPALGLRLYPRAIQACGPVFIFKQTFISMTRRFMRLLSLKS